MAETHEGWKFRGRGSVSNPTGRFESSATLPIDDGWGSLEQDEPEALETTVSVDTSRAILSHNDSPDVPFGASINPYQGCEHGCIYCYARPTHSYYNRSPGLDFETQLFYKPEAARLLEDALRKPGYSPTPIALGANTDPYQPIEKKYEVTRQLLKVLLEFNHPASIVTKSALVLRDLDILKPMAERNLIKVFVSVTTLDAGLARKMEPRASTPSRRLLAIQKLSAEGIPVGVMAAPMIPGLNDRDLEGILAAASQAGALWAGYTFIRLPYEVKDLFMAWLQEHFPDAAPKVEGLIRDARRGGLNVSEFGERMRGSGPVAELIRKRFEVAVRKQGLNTVNRPLDSSRFAPPPKAGDQLTLFSLPKVSPQKKKAGMEAPVGRGSGHDEARSEQLDGENKAAVSALGELQKVGAFRV